VNVGKPKSEPAWPKLARLEAPDMQLEELTRQMIAGREWLFRKDLQTNRACRKRYLTRPRNWT
jgi:hypothetical protein